MKKFIISGVVFFLGIALFIPVFIYLIPGITTHYEINPDYKISFILTFILLYAFFAFLFWRAYIFLLNNMSQKIHKIKRILIKVIGVIVFLGATAIYIFIFSFWWYFNLPFWKGTLYKKINYTGYKEIIYVYDELFFDPKTSIKLKIPFTPYLKTYKEFWGWYTPDLRFYRKGDYFLVKRYWSDDVIFRLKLTKK